MEILKPHEIKLNSILDNDLYKFSMMWAVMNHFPDAIVRYEFVSRNKEQKYPKNIGVYLRQIIDNTREVKLTQAERIEFQSKCGKYLPNLFFDFLSGFRLDPSEVGIIQNGDQLMITIEGYWYRTILWEIIIMSLLSELYYSILFAEGNIKEIDWNLVSNNDAKKINLFRLNGLKLVDFGTRRRFSYNNQKRVLDILKSGSLGNNGLIGSSNVKFAIDNNIKVIGTYAHEWVSGIASLLGYAHANKWAMELWTQTYKGDLGIALTDTFGIDSFLKDFDKKYAELFTGVRHDSGDPYKFVDIMFIHYLNLGIDPKDKTIVFSDGLTTDEAIKISEYCMNKIKCSFGIGTHLTNDIPNVNPLNIVIKLFEINGKNVIKLSDTNGKHTGNPRTIQLVKELIGYKSINQFSY